MIIQEGRKEEKVSEENLGFFGAKRMEFLIMNYGSVYQRAFLDGALEKHCRRVQMQAEKKYQSLVKEFSEAKIDEAEEADKVAQELVLRKMVFIL